MHYRIITLLHPFTSEENRNYATKAESTMMAYMIIKLRANELFKDNFECQWRQEKLMKKKSLFYTEGEQIWYALPHLPLPALLHAYLSPRRITHYMN